MNIYKYLIKDKNSYIIITIFLLKICQNFRNILGGVKFTKIKSYRIALKICMSKCYPNLFLWFQGKNIFLGWNVTLESLIVIDMKVTELLWIILGTFRPILWGEVKQSWGELVLGVANRQNVATIFFDAIFSKPRVSNFYNFESKFFKVF